MKPVNYKTKINRLTNESIAILALRIIDTVIKSVIAKAKNTKQFLNLSDTSNRYQQAIDPNDKKAGGNIDAKYEERKTLFLSMYDYLYGLLNSPDDDMRIAAEKLFAIVNKYGRTFGNIKVADQSLRYIRIIESLKSSELTQALSTTLLTDKLAVLNNIQLEYEDLYIGRSNTKTQNVAATTMRPEMEEAIKLYVDELQWMTDQNGTADWKQLETQVLARIDDMKPTLWRKPKATDSTTETKNTDSAESKSSENATPAP